MNQKNINIETLNLPYDLNQAFHSDCFLVLQKFSTKKGMKFKYTNLNGNKTIDKIYDDSRNEKPNIKCGKHKEIEAAEIRYLKKKFKKIDLSKDYYYKHTFLVYSEKNYLLDKKNQKSLNNVYGISNKNISDYKDSLNFKDLVKNDDEIYDSFRFNGRNYLVYKE